MMLNEFYADPYQANLTGKLNFGSRSTSTSPYRVANHEAIINNLQRRESSRQIKWLHLSPVKAARKSAMRTFDAFSKSPDFSVPVFSYLKWKVIFLFTLQIPTYCEAIF